MKIRILLFTFLICTAGAVQLSLTQDTTLTLTDAISKNMVQCSITGNPNSTHYIRPIVANVKNTQSTPVIITLQAGEMFEPDDPGYQNMMIVQGGTIRLNPGEQKEVPIYRLASGKPQGRRPGTASAVAGGGWCRQRFGYHADSHRLL